MHVDGTVALPGEAVAEAEEAPFGVAHQPRKGFDLGLGHTADGFCPLRGPLLQM